MRKQLLFLLLICAFTGVYSQTPVATVYSGTTTFCQGSRVTLKSSIGSGNRWYRNGIATSSVGQYFYATTTGSYSVYANGAMSNAIQVTVNPKPTATISPAGTNNVITICGGGTVMLSASDTGPGVTYLWSTGATTRTIAVNYAGSFYVTVTNANGCTKRSVTKTTILQSMPSAVTISSSGSLEFCSGGSVELRASSATGYRWFRNNISISGATSSTYIATTSGTYTVKAYNGYCYSAISNPIKVVVNSLPAAIISPSTAVNLCNGSTATLTSSYAGTGGSYLWSTGETTRSINVGTPGDYTVTVKNLKGCTRTSITKVVSETENATITAYDSRRFCEGDSVILTASDASRYFWSTGDTTQSITVHTSDIFAVKTIDSYGCETKSAEIETHVAPLPLVDAGPDHTLYIGYGQQSAEIDCEVTGEAPFNYLWSTSDTTYDITVSPSTTTVYSVNVSDNNGCISTDQVTVNIIDVTCGTGKVKICHGEGNGSHSICVSPTAVEQHLAHGDYLGDCNQSSSRFANYTGESKTIGTVTNLNVFPNPFNKSTMLSYSLLDNSTVTIEVYNVLGSKVKTIVNSTQEMGNYQLPIDFEEGKFDDGIYFIKFTNGDETSMIRIVKTK